jgi:hypothetical protein
MKWYAINQLDKEKNYGKYLFRFYFNEIHEENIQFS